MIKILNRLKAWLIYGVKFIVYIAKFIVWETKKLVMKYPKFIAIAVGTAIVFFAVVLSTPSILRWIHRPRPLALTVAPASSGFQFAAADKKTQFSVLIGEAGNNTPKIQATFSGGSSVDFVLTDLNQNISKPSKTGNKVIFKDVRPNVDLSYQTLTNGIKEEIIVKKPQEGLPAQAGNAFTFTLNNFGAAPKKIAPQTYGSVFYDTQGAYAFHFSKPFAVDAKGNRTDNVLLSIHKADTDQSYKATVIVNKKWLADPARVYPISIDPTVVHDTTAEFAAGQMNRVIDSNTQYPIVTGVSTGTGNDGAVTISANKNINTDIIKAGGSYADGIAYAVTALGSNTITVSSTNGIAATDEVLLINMRGDATNNGNVGNYEFLTVQSVTSTVITLSSDIQKIYGATSSNSDLTGQKVIVQRVPNYTDVTISSGYTLTASAWNGTTGGIVAFRASGTVTVTGTISTSALGYVGGAGISANTGGPGGESFCGAGGTASSGTGAGGGGGDDATGGTGSCGGGGGGGASNNTGGTGSAAKGGAGGGGGRVGGSAGGGGYGSAGGGGGACATAGSAGGTNSSANGGNGNTGVRGGGGGGGGTYGSSDLSTLFLGSAGGVGGGYASYTSGGGGNGGGIVVINANTLSGSGSIVANGAIGGNTTGGLYGGGGGGAGGSIKASVNTITLGSSSITATGGSGGTGTCSGTGGAGGNGRIYTTLIGNAPNLTTYYQELSTDINTIGLYHFGNGACATDGSGNAYTLTANGGMTCATGGMFGYKASGFATTPVSYSHATILDRALPAGTIETWINPTNLSAVQTILYADSTSDTLLTLGTSGQINFSTSASTNLATANNVIAINTWTHVAATWTTAGHKIFINGVETASDTNTTTHTSQDYTTYVGVGSGGNTLPFSGSIDELRISNIARTPEEIKLDAQRRPYSVYTSDVIDLSTVSGWNSLSWTELGVHTGDGETLSSSTSLVAQWNFNETSGTTADNAETTADRDFTLNNFASTASQDQAAATGWTAANKRWGTGGIMLSSVATADTLSITNPGSNGLDPYSSDLSIEMWVKTNDVTAELLSNNSANGVACTSNGYYLGIDASGYPIFYLDTNGATAGCDAQISAPTTKINDGKWHMLAVSVTRGTSATMYLDGVNIGSDTSVTSYSSITVAGNVLVGSTNAFDGIIDSTRVYSRALGQNEILSNYQAGNVEFQTRVGGSTDPNDGTWEAWKPTSGETAIAAMDSDSANWTQDYTNTVGPYTKSLLYMNGTDASTTFTDESGKTWTANGNAQIDTAQSKFGGASGLFDGTGDYVDTPDHADFEFGSGNFTIDAWVMVHADPGLFYVVGKGNNVNALPYGLGRNFATSAFRGNIYNDSTNLYVVGTTVPTLDVWYHLALVRNGNNLNLYVNGTAEGGTTDVTGVTIPDQAFKAAIGRPGEGDAFYFNGWIDELRISKGIARWTANFTPPTSAHTIFSPSSFGWTAKSDDSNTKIEGTGSLKIAPGSFQVDEVTVGLWHLDETGGTGAYIKDSTANANNGTPTGTTVVNGFAGKARLFDDIDDIVTIPDSSNLDLSTNGTVEAWIKTNANEANNWFICKSSNYCLGVNATGAFLFTGASAQDNAGTSLLAGTWHHVAVTNNNTTATYYIDGAAAGTDAVGWGTTLTNALIFGRDGGTNFFDGLIDEVRISNVVRTAEEIAEAYRAGRDHYINKTLSSTDLSSKTSLPFYVASDRQGTFLNATIGESAYANYQTDANTTLLWHLDEQSGTANTFIKDSSGNGRNSSTITETTYAQGQIGKARYFDGSNDLISRASMITYNTSRTIDFWFYPTSTGSQKGIVSFGSTTGDTTPIVLIVQTAANLFSVYHGGNYRNGTTVLTANRWYHGAYTFDSSNNAAALYLNGKLEYSGTVADYNGNNTNMYVGAGFGGYFPGNIDEVRVSNSVRTADQIRQSYEVGARTHNITVDFKAALNSGNLITNTSDLGFTIDATSYGASSMGSNLYLGDKIIVKENYDGTEYIAQGTVNSLNTSTGAVTVTAWDSGSTVPSGGFTVNATIFKWQREYFDLRGSLSTHRDAITNLTLRETDGTQGANVWLDDFRSSGGYLTTPAGSTMTSTAGNQYFQYRIIETSFDTNVSTSVTSATIDYVSNVPCPPTIGTPTNMTASAIQWNFTGGCQGSSAIIGFKVYDGSNNLVKTCDGAAITSCTETGLSTNTQYTRKVVAYNSYGNSNYSATATKYTLAVVPAAPATSEAAATSVKVTPSGGTNPAGTELAIYKETGTTCDGSGGSYIAANGSDNGATAVWQTAAQWSAVTATGLNLEANFYAFCVKARNGDTTETAFGSAISDNGGFVPFTASALTITQNIGAGVKRYVDGANASRWVWGLDSGTTDNTAVLTMSKGTLTMLADTTLVAGSVVFPNGPVVDGVDTQITMASGAQMKLGSDMHLWTVDADADGFPSVAKVWYGTTGPANSRRLKNMTTMNAVDCDDNTYKLDNVCCVGSGGSCTADVDCCAGVPACGTDTDSDSYFSSTQMHVGTCQTSKPYTDCNDSGTNAGNVWISATCYVDGDNDDVGSSTSKTCMNNATCGSATWGSGAEGTAATNTNFSTSNTDCDDGDGSRYPGNTNCYCDANDHDCAGVTQCTTVYTCSSCNGGAGRINPNSGIASGTSCGQQGTWWNVITTACWAGTTCQAQAQGTQCMQCR